MSAERNDPPGAVSDQNAEEQPSELRQDGEHPEPRTGGPGAGSDGDDDSTGAAGEGSQSTGHPGNAG